MPDWAPVMADLPVGIICTDSVLYVDGIVSLNEKIMEFIPRRFHYGFT